MPSVIVTVLGTVVAAAISGGPEAIGLALGGVIVLAFFGADFVALRMSADWDPATTFLLVMIEYVTKIVLLGLLLLGLSDQDVVNGRSLALAVGLNTVVFLGFLVVAHVQIPTFVVVPAASETNDNQQT